jgi:D-sedoheptulose 7-phosphate isomerase
MTVIGMTGVSGRRFAASCDHALVAPGRSTPRIQEAHIALGHTLCELVERAMFKPPAHAGRRPGRTTRRGARAT